MTVGSISFFEPITAVFSTLAVPAGKGSEHNVVDASGAPVIDAFLWRQEALIAGEVVDRDLVNPSIRMPGTWLFGGVFRPHFGHFLFESASRLWAVPHLRQQLDGIVFFRWRPRRSSSEESADIPAIQAQVLELLGIDLPVHFIDLPTEFETLIVPRPGCGMGPLSVGTPAFRAFVREQLQKIPPRQGAERVYLTREGYQMRRGGILAEAHLRELLEAEGYVAFSPEKHSLEEQVATYLGARQIIGPDSSALHLVGFVAPPEAKVAIVLRRPEGAKDLLPQLTGFMGRRPLVVNAIDRLYRRENEKNETWSLLADLDFLKLRDALQAGGFIDGAAKWTMLRRSRRVRALAKCQRRFGSPCTQIWPAAARKALPSVPDGPELAG